MKKLTFEDQPDGKKITQMVSPEAEHVDLLNQIKPQGDADIWLNDVEKQMKLTIKDSISRSWVDYSENVLGIEEVQAGD